ncbi:MAG: hypothetical protein H6Q90_4322 [Deltaproteobacteria bacterium]|nr:hypothetical protein [Deltaproteobacteria bacterium]
MTQACKLLELVEQAGLVRTAWHHLERPQLVRLDVEHLENTAKRAASRHGDPTKPAVDQRATCHQGCHHSMTTRLAARVNRIGGAPQGPKWIEPARAPSARGTGGQGTLAPVPEDDRTRRRLGDATKARIDDLASGWAVDGEEPAPGPAPGPAPAPANAPRQKTKTVPPPPPGSAARKALEDSIVNSMGPAPIAVPRTKPPTAPPGARTGPTATLAREPAGTVGSGAVRSGAVGSSSGALPVIPAAPTGPRSKPALFGAKSGPTDTGTVSRSGLIGANTGPVPLTGPTATGTPSSPTAVPDRVAGTASGPILPAARSGPRTQPPHPPPATKVGSTSGSTAKLDLPSDARLPLRADATEVSPPLPPIPPPLPPQRAFRPPVMFDEPSQETIPEDHPGAMPRPVVPVGEFDQAGTEIEQDKLRISYEQSTHKRDPANAILGIAEPSETQVKSPSVQVLLEETAQHLLRRDPSGADSSETLPFERGDPTGDRLDLTIASQPAGHGGGGKLRTGAALRRKRGFGGDLRYVATVLFGVRRARLELVELEARQAIRQQSRHRHLVTLGRAAVTLDRFDHPALGPARERLAGIEEERSQHAGSVAAADSELTRVRRDREAKAKQYITDRANVEIDLADIARKLEPLEKEALQIGKRAAELRESLLRIEKTIAATEASLVAVRSQSVDRAGIQAELATLHADRMAVQRDEPKIASELDVLNPRIADLEARRIDARKRYADLERAEREDQRRAEELLAAIGAKRKVVDRAAGDAEVLRDKVLFELGERLFVDQPDDLGAQLAPIDVIDVELGTGERRSMELREILASIDKAKLVRGLALGVLGVALIGGTVTLLVALALR